MLETCRLDPARPPLKAMSASRTARSAWAIRVPPLSPWQTGARPSGIRPTTWSTVVRRASSFIFNGLLRFQDGRCTGPNASGPCGRSHLV